MEIDLEIMGEIVRASHEPFIFEKLGNDGVKILKKLEKCLRDVYAVIDPGLLEKPLYLVKTDNDLPLPIESDPTEITPAEWINLSSTVDPKASTLIQHFEGKRLFIWKGISINVLDFPSNALVYEFNRSSEKFIVEGEAREILNPYPLHPSVFAVPTFTDLKNALLNYKAEAVKKSSCPIFNEVWHDPYRKFFKNKPEFPMRDSLVWYLNVWLRDADVEPEQNVDETKPVDIRVTWNLTKKRSIIEIKWLGKSVSSSGAAVSTTYSDARANEGAHQLADYLEREQRKIPTTEIRGYLVIIDGRRHGYTAIDSQPADLIEG